MCHTIEHRNEVRLVTQQAARVFPKPFLACLGTYLQSELGDTNQGWVLSSYPLMPSLLPDLPTSGSMGDTHKEE